MATCSWKNLEVFESYFNIFHAKGGVYPSERDHIGKHELAEAISKLDDWGGGDSLDREHVRDIIFSKEEIDKMYS